jgi:hypothetical protein
MGFKFCPWGKCLDVACHASTERSRGIALPILDPGARMKWVANATTRLLYPREWHGTYFTGGWVGPRAALENFLPQRGSNPPTVQTVASRNADYAIPAPEFCFVGRPTQMCMRFNSNCNNLSGEEMWVLGGKSIGYISPGFGKFRKWKERKRKARLHSQDSSSCAAISMLLQTSKLS